MTNREVFNWRRFLATPPVYAVMYHDPVGVESVCELYTTREGAQMRIDHINRHRPKSAKRYRVRTWHIHTDELARELWGEVETE